MDTCGIIILPYFCMFLRQMNSRHTNQGASTILTNSLYNTGKNLYYTDKDGKQLVQLKCGEI